MRVEFGRLAEPAGGAVARDLSTGWLRAGFSGFAYRLAHLALPRPVSVMGVVLVFYLV
jgi:hypothetical protein